MKRQGGVAEAVVGGEGICDENKSERAGEREREREKKRNGGSEKVKRRRGLRETDIVGDRGRMIQGMQNDGEGWDLDAHGD